MVCLPCAHAWLYIFHTHMLVSVPGLPNIQFLITAKNGRGKPGPFYHVKEGGRGPRSKNAFHAHVLRFKQE